MSMASPFRRGRTGQHNRQSETKAATVEILQGGGGGCTDLLFISRAGGRVTLGRALRLTVTWSISQSIYLVAFSAQWTRFVFPLLPEVTFALPFFLFNSIDYDGVPSNEAASSEQQRRLQIKTTQII